jgi:hypothetical protein
MYTEKEIEAFLADELLGVIKDPKNDTTVEKFCQEYHVVRHRLTSKKLFSMTDRTLFRIMLGIAQLASREDFVEMCIRIANITYQVASMDDGSPEAIKQAHAGSPIGRKKKS